MTVFPRGTVIVAPIQELRSYFVEGQFQKQRYERLNTWNLAMANKGFVAVVEAEVAPPQIDSRVPHNTLEQISESLSFSPRPLTNGRLIHVTAGGDYKATKKTNLHRLYDIESVGIVSIYEHDYVTSGTVVLTAEESLNSNISGQRASMFVLKSPSKTIRVIADWHTDRLTYNLQLWSTYHRKVDLLRQIQHIVEQLTSR